MVEWNNLKIELKWTECLKKWANEKNEWIMNGLMNEWMNEWMNKYLKGGKIECSIPDAKLISLFWIWKSKVEVTKKQKKQKQVISGHFDTLVRSYMCSHMVISLHMTNLWYQDISFVQLQGFKKTFAKLYLSYCGGHSEPKTAKQVE